MSVARTIVALTLALLANGLFGLGNLHAGSTPSMQNTIEASNPTLTPSSNTHAPRDVTYSTLMSLRNSASFVPNQWYRITDFRTRWYSRLTQKAHEGTPEPLLVQAVSNKQIALRAYSEKYPDDEIDYIIYDGSLHGETVNGVQVPSNDRGGIIRRKDILRSIECWFDFRAYTVRLFETKPGSGVYRHDGSGPAYVDRNLFDVARSAQVVIKRAVTEWRNEDGTTDFTKGTGNPEHYLGYCDRVQIGLSSWRIRMYGDQVVNAIFGECTDDITSEGNWDNTQMLGFNNSVSFNKTIESSIFLGGVENLHFAEKVSRSTFLPGIIGVVFKGPLSDCLIFPHPFRKNGYTYETEKTREMIGASPAALGAIEEAPNDGKMYVRQNGKWVELKRR